MSGSRPTQMVGDTRLEESQSRVLCEFPRDSLQRIIVGKVCVVVQEKQKFSTDVWQAGIPTSRRTKVLRECNGTSRLRKPIRAPAVANDYNLDLNPSLRNDGSQR